MNPIGTVAPTFTPFGIDGDPEYVVRRLNSADLDYLREAVDGAIGRRPDSDEA